MGDASGWLGSLRLAARREMLRGSGYVDVAGISVGADRLSIGIVKSDGDVHQALRSSADKAVARVVEGLQAFTRS